MLIKAHNKPVSLVIYTKEKVKNLNIEFISSHRLTMALSDLISSGCRLFHFSCNLASRSGFFQWPHISEIYTQRLHSSCSAPTRYMLQQAKGNPLHSNSFPFGRERKLPQSLQSGDVSYHLDCSTGSPFERKSFRCLLPLVQHLHRRIQNHTLFVQFQKNSGARRCALLKANTLFDIPAL